jgi:hypothetical protein
MKALQSTLIISYFVPEFHLMSFPVAGFMNQQVLYV